jgi:signal transduction histidine kinase
MAPRGKPKKAKADAKRPRIRRPPKESTARVRGLEKRLAAALEQLQTRDLELAEALEQQTAMEEVLRIISSSPTDTQPVLDTVAESAARLCEASDVAIFRLEGVGVRPVAHRGPIPVHPTSHAPISLHGTVPGRSVLEGRTVHVTDLQAETAEFPEGSEFARLFRFRTSLSVPLMRHGVAIGTITLRRTEARRFSDRQVKLLRTFADQAAIAIENVRLFTELEASNRDLTRTLEQQTATSEILRSISSSVIEVQPVFETIVNSGSRLLGGYSATIMLLRDDRLELVAYTSTGAEADASLRQMFPIPLPSMPPAERAVRERRTYVLDDVETATDVTNTMREIIRARGWRSALFVPMQRDDAVIGLISVTRRVTGAFAHDEIALLETFAAQAVIAIENTRLFKELQHKNEALTEAHAQVTESLEQQTASAEILRVISRSPTDVQPVFDVIASSALQLCDGVAGLVFRHDGTLVHLAAFAGAEGVDLEPLRHIFPAPAERVTFAGRVMTMARPLYIGDIEHDQDAPPGLVAFAGANGFRSVFATPMLRDGQAIGAIAAMHRDGNAFTREQRALLETFAAQAVIAIENVRLFKELEARTHDLTRSVGELTALGEVGRALSSTLDVDMVLDTIVARANDLIGADGCTIFEYDEAGEQFHLRATRNLEPRLVELARGTSLRRGDQGILGQLPSERRAIQVADITVGSYSSPISDALIQAGYRAVVVVPLVREDHLIGALTMNRKTPGEFSPETIQLLETFATQSALAIQNARLFREIEDKGRQLAAASQHKSEFLASMSHELRTPLNAIIGYSELLEEEAGDLDSGRLVPDLQKIATAAKHQLSLINDILDLSKVEAGRMELEVADFDLPTAIQNALTLVQERASRRGVVLSGAIHERVGAIRADERKVKQVILNLLSNALKFTPEGGRVDVEAVVDGERVVVSVADTGVGIAPEDQEKVFEEFQQVGTAAKKVEGTGLGLTLCRKFVELHGGRIWVKSEPGQGSTFTFTLPVGRPD